MVDLEAKIRQLETQLQEKDAKVSQLESQLQEKDTTLSQVHCKLIQTKQQLSTAEQQINTHKDYKLKLEQVLGNMQVQHELIIAKLTQAGQPVGTDLLSQNKMRLELHETFESDRRAQVSSLVVDKEKLIYESHQDLPKKFQVTMQPETLTFPTQCHGDSKQQVFKIKRLYGTESHNVRMMILKPSIISNCTSTKITTYWDIIGTDKELQLHAYISHESG